MLTKSLTNILLCSHVFGIVIPIIAYSLICMLRGNYDTSAWYFPFDFDILLDPSVIWVWYLRAFDYVWGGFAHIFISSGVILYLVSCCFYIKASCKHFKSIFDECDGIISATCDDKATQAAIISGKIKNAVAVHMKITE